MDIFPSYCTLMICLPFLFQTRPQTVVEGTSVLVSKALESEPERREAPATEEAEGEGEATMRSRASFSSMAVPVGASIDSRAPEVAFQISRSPAQGQANTGA